MDSITINKGENSSKHREVQIGKMEATYKTIIGSASATLRLVSLNNIWIPIPIIAVYHIIEGLQLIGLCFINEEPWPDNFKYFRFGINLLNLYSAQGTLPLLASSKMNLFIIAIGIAFLWIILFIIIGISYSKKTYQIKPVIIITQIATDTIVTIGFIPMLLAIISPVFCKLWAEPCSITFPLSLFFATIFFVISGIVVLTNFESRYLLSKRVIKYTGRADAIFHLVKGVSVLSVLLYQLDLAQSVIAIIHLSISVISSFIGLIFFLYYIPYYSDNLNKIRVITLLSVFWSALMSLILSIINFPSNTLAWIYFWGLPPIILLGGLIYHRRISSILNKKTSILKSAWEVEVHVKEAIKIYLKSYKTADNQEILKFCNSIKLLYFSGKKNMPRNFALCILSANFIYSFDVANSTFLIMRLLQEASSLSPPFDGQFIILKMREFFSSSANVDGQGIMSFVECEKYCAIAQTNDKLACYNLKEFWAELGNPRPDDQRLRTFAESVSRYVNCALQAYKSIVRVAPNNTEMLINFADFLEEVANDKDMANALRERAQRIKEVQPSKKGSNNNYVQPSLVVGGSSRLGEILSVHNIFCEIHKYSVSEITGRNCNILVPFPFRPLHDGFLKSFLQVGTVKFINRVINLITVNSRGYYVPVRALIKAFNPDVSSVQFMVNAEPLEKVYEYLMIGPNDLVYGFTEGLQPYITGLPTSEIDYKLSFRIPDFHTFINSIRSNNINRLKSITMATYISRGSLHTPVNVHVEPFEVNNSDIEETDQRKVLWLLLIINVSAQDVGITKHKKQNSCFSIYSALPDYVPEMYHRFYEGGISLPMVTDEDINSEKIDIEISHDIDMDIPDMSFNLKSYSVEPSIKTETVKKKPEILPSVTQKGNSYLVAQVSTAIKIFRKIVVYSNAPDRGMRLFRRIYWFVIFLGFSLALYSYLIMNTMIQQFLDWNNLIQNQGLQKYAVLDSVKSVHDLMSLENTNLSNKYLDLGNLDDIDQDGIKALEYRSRLLNNIGHILAVDDTIYKSDNLSVPSELRDLYYKPNILIKTLSGSTVSQNLMTQFESNSIFSQAIKDIAYLPLNEITRQHPSVFFLLENGKYSISKGLKNSAEIIQQSSGKLYSSMELDTLAQTIVTCTILLLMMALVVQPVTTRIERDKKQVLTFFFGLNDKFIKRMYNRINRRLVSLDKPNQAYLDDDGVDENTSVNQSPINHNLNIVVNKSIKPPRKIRITNGLKSVFGLNMLKLSSIFLISVIYFIAGHFLGYLNTRELYNHFPIQNNWINLRVSNTYETVLSLKYLSSCTDLYHSYAATMFEYRTGLLTSNQADTVLSELAKRQWPCKLPQKLTFLAKDQNKEKSQPAPKSERIAEGCVNGPYCDELAPYCSRGTFDYLGFQSSPLINTEYICKSNLICNAVQAASECCICGGGFCDTKDIFRLDYGIDKALAASQCGNKQNNEVCMFSDICRDDKEPQGQIRCMNSSWLKEGFCDPGVPVNTKIDFVTEPSLLNVLEESTEKINLLEIIMYGNEYGNEDADLLGSYHFVARHSKPIEEITHIAGCVSDNTYWSRLEAQFTFDDNGLSLNTVTASQDNDNSNDDSNNEINNDNSNDNNSSNNRAFLKGISLNDRKYFITKYNESYQRNISGCSECKNKKRSLSSSYEMVDHKKRSRYHEFDSKSKNTKQRTNQNIVKFKNTSQISLFHHKANRLLAKLGKIINISKESSNIKKDDIFYDNISDTKKRIHNEKNEKSFIDRKNINDIYQRSSELTYKVNKNVNQLRNLTNSLVIKKKVDEHSIELASSVSPKYKNSKIHAILVESNNSSLLYRMNRASVQGFKDWKNKNSKRNSNITKEYKKFGTNIVQSKDDSTNKFSRAYITNLGHAISSSLDKTVRAFIADIKSLPKNILNYEKSSNSASNSTEKEELIEFINRLKRRKLARWYQRLMVLDEAWGDINEETVTEIDVCEKLPLFSGALNGTIYFIDEARGIQYNYEKISNKLIKTIDSMNSNLTVLELKTQLEGIKEANVMAKVRLQSLIDYERQFLFDSNRKLAEQYFIYVKSYVDFEFYGIYLYLTYGYLATLLLLYFFLVRPFMNFLENQVRMTRSMLLMVPEEYIAEIPSLRDFLLQFLAQQGLITQQ